MRVIKIKLVGSTLLCVIYFNFLKLKANIPAIYKVLLSKSTYLKVMLSQGLTPFTTSDDQALWHNCKTTITSRHYQHAKSE